MTEEFHDKVTWCRSLSSTFLSLILKKAEVEEISDFHPISLVGSIYKLVAKPLSCLLEKVMEKIISHPQRAFVKRQCYLQSRHGEIVRPSKLGFLGLVMRNIEFGPIMEKLDKDLHFLSFLFNYN